jgi:hypothetical protein
MYIKQEMVRSAAWKVRSNVSAAFLAEELTQEDVEAAISSRANGSLNALSSRGGLF